MSTFSCDSKAKELGLRIRHEIRIKGLKQAEFAKMLGITPSRLSNYVTGARVPDIFVLSAIAENLNLSIDYLCGISDGRGGFPKSFYITVYESGKVNLTEMT